jgi:hypothetical protein
MVPAAFLMCLGSLFFGIPPVYEYSTNTYLGEGKVERNPYEVLGVTSTDSMESIKKSFKKLSMKYHPDKNPNATKTEAAANIDTMAELNSAMEKIKKGNTMHWGTGEDGWLSEDGINRVANKWVVIMAAVQKKGEEWQVEFKKRLKEKQKLKKKHGHHRRPNEILNEDFTAGVDCIGEMFFGVTIFESIDEESVQRKPAPPPLTPMDKLKNELGEMAHLLPKEVLDQMLLDRQGMGDEAEEL